MAMVPVSEKSHSLLTRLMQKAKEQIQLVIQVMVS